MKLTDEQVQEIKNAPRSVTHVELARKFGVSHTHVRAIRNCSVRTGVARKQRKISEEDRLKIRELYASGDYTQQALAKFFNISLPQVYNILIEHREETPKAKEKIPRQFLQL